MWTLKLLQFSDIGIILDKLKVGPLCFMVGSKYSPPPLPPQSVIHMMALVLSPAESEEQQ